MTDLNERAFDMSHFLHHAWNIKIINLGVAFSENKLLTKHIFIYKEDIVELHTIIFKFQDY